MPLPLAEIEHRSAEGVDVAGIGQLGLHLARRETGELREEAEAPLADIARQLDLVIGKIEERARRGEFLPLEHRECPADITLRVLRLGRATATLVCHIPL